MDTPKIKAKCTLRGGTEIEAYVVNPGGWFGKAHLIQVAIANALNPFYVIEAQDFQSAIDYLADSDEYGHLINMDEEDIDEDDENLTRAGNDSHVVNLDNVCPHNITSIKYYLEIEDITESTLVADIQTAIEDWAALN